MTFQGMVWSSVRPQVIIDNKVYDVGDVIALGEGEAAHVKIIDIDKQGIHLKYMGKGLLVRPK